jgi:ferritin-like metal-binding protein YciE
MAKGASAKSLQTAFQKHLKQTEGHVARLEKVFDNLGLSPRGKKCQGMEGLIAEGDEILSEDAEPEVRDAALISAAQHVEHYEMAGYGCARTYAQLLGNKKAAALLQQTLNEEGATDKQLTKLAEKINVQADEAPTKPARKKAKRAKKKPLVQKVREAVGL